MLYIFDDVYTCLDSLRSMTLILKWSTSAESPPTGENEVVNLYFTFLTNMTVISSDCWDIFNVYTNTRELDQLVFVITSTYIKTLKTPTTKMV